MPITISLPPGFCSSCLAGSSCLTRELICASIPRNRPGASGRLARWALTSRRFVTASLDFMSPKKGLFDLGDVAGLADPSAVRWEKTNAPAVMQDLRYDFTRNNGEIVRIYYVENEPAFHLLENALRRIRDSSERR